MWHEIRHFYLAKQDILPGVVGSNDTSTISASSSS